MVKAIRKDCQRISGSRYVDDAFPRIYHGMSEFVLTSGTFSTVDLLHLILEKIGPSYVDCSSWCSSKGSMRNVHDFLEDGRIIEFRMIMDGGADRVKNDFYKFVVKEMGINSIALMPNHSKISAVYNSEWSFVIETSANFTYIARCEHYRLSEDPKFCRWVVGYFDSIFELKNRVGGRIYKGDLEGVYR